MQISFDPMNPDECSLLADILEATNGKAEAKATTAPAKKAAAAPRKSAAAAKKAEPEDDDVLGGGDGPTKADAVKRATELVEAGETATVRTALKSVGVKRVTDLEDDQVEDFLDALSV